MEISNAKEKGGFQKSEVNMNIMKYHEISIESTVYQYFINMYPCR